MTDTALTILDGSIGQELINRSSMPPTELWSTRVMIEEPELVRSVHDDYFAAGADMATANTYPVLRDRLAQQGLEDQLERLQTLACEIACRSRDAHGSGFVAGALGPLGWSYSHHGAPDGERAAELYDEICRIQSPLVDVFLIETIGNIEQMEGALAGTVGHGKPVWLGLTVDDADGTKLRSGEPLQDALTALAKRPPDTLLLNCSQPEAIKQGLPVIAGSGLPFGAYANGFQKIIMHLLVRGSTVEEMGPREDLTPEKYADHVDHWVELGASFVGGCCEVGPNHIREMVRRHRGEP